MSTLFEFESQSHKLGIQFIRKLNFLLSYLETSKSKTSSSNSLLPGRGGFKGCGMGPWLVLVSPCFRENVVATCKIGSFLCSLDNLLQKNVIVFFFGNQIAKWCSFEKGAIFDLLFTFFSQQGKATKIPSAHISLTYIYVFCSPYWLFLPYQFWKKIRIYQVRFLFGMSPGVDSYSRHFGTINKLQNGEQNLSWNVYYWYVLTLMPNL